MENMQYAEDLIREFLLFRGFTNTLQAFETELSTDIGQGFEVDKIMDLVFSLYIPKFEAEKMVNLLSFLKQCVSSSSEMVLISTLSKLEVSILRYYIVHALRSGRQDKVLDFFGAHGNNFLQTSADWTPWFAIPYIKNPNLDPQFRVFFSKEWIDALYLSFRNFLSEIFNGTRIPALLKISTEKNTIKRLKKDIKQLNDKLLELQAILESKEAQLLQLRSASMLAMDVDMLRKNSSQVNSPRGISTKDLIEENNISSRNLHETTSTISSSHSGDSGANTQIQGVFGHAKGRHELTSPDPEYGSRSLVMLPIGDVSSGNSLVTFRENLYSGSSDEVIREEEFPEVKVDFQETFLGHTGPISRCRFSAAGTNIASASIDRTVRIWTYDSSTPTSRNATIYCGAEVMSLDWECKSDRLARLMAVLKHGMLMQRESSVMSALLQHIQVSWT